MIKISLNLPEEMKEDLDWLAAEEERPMSWIIRKAIQEYLEKHIEYEENEKE